MSNGLEIKNLNAGYIKRKVISNLTLPTMSHSKITMLIGPNGSGKSTFLRAIAGLIPVRGELLLDNINLNKLSSLERAKLVGYLPQSLPENVRLRVFESLLLAYRTSSHYNADLSHSEAMGILEKLNISYLSMRYINELSGGQKQLVSLAQSLIRKPNLLLLDEPISALDLSYQYLVMQIIRQETRERNMVTIMIIHDINTTLYYGDHIIMIKDGGLIDSGAPKDVIVPKNLAKVYGVNTRIVVSDQGIPQVFIEGLT